MVIVRVSGLLQYLTLCLLAFYFGKAVLKTKWNVEPQKYRKQLRITFGILISIFLASTIVYSVVMSSVVNPSAETQRALGISRVAISQTLFVVTAFALCVCILQLKRASSANLLLEGQGTSICQATTVCIVIGLLFVSRAVYDLLAVSLISLPKFGYGWIYVSDEAETVNGGTLRHETGSNGFVSFGIVLFIWELLPTFIVVWFFRVRRPPMDALVSNVITSNSFNRRSFFFDNIRRYDSDADLYAASSPPRIGSQYDIPGDGLSASVVNSYNDISDRRNSSYSDRRNNSYGDRRNNSFAAINGFVPGTTPPLLFSGSNQYQPSNIGPVTAYR